MTATPRGRGSARAGSVSGRSTRAAAGFDAPPPDGDHDADAPGDPEAVARIVCLNLLERRARSRSELATALRTRGVPDEAAERVLDRFVEVGLIDDAAYADGFAQAQLRERGLAGRAIAMKLRQRGVDDEVVRATVEQIDGDDELVVARALVAKKLRSLQQLEPQVQARRLVGLLGRKGYASTVAYRVVREAMAEASADVAGLDVEPESL